MLPDYRSIIQPFDYRLKLRMMKHFYQSQCCTDICRSTKVEKLHVSVHGTEMYTGAYRRLCSLPEQGLLNDQQQGCESNREHF